MSLKKSQLAIVLMLCSAFSQLVLAEIISTKSLNGITHQFTFNSVQDASSVFTDVQQNIDIFNKPPQGRVGMVVVTTQNNSSFTVIRTDADTYVIAQPGSGGSTAYTTIHKAGGVQTELYSYLLNGSTAYAKGGIDAATLVKVNTILNNVKTAVPDSSVAAAANTQFINGLAQTFSGGTGVTPVPPGPPFDIKSAVNTAVNNQMKNGELQGSPASHVAQMSYFDQTLDLGGVAGGNLFADDGSDKHQSKLAVKTRLSNYDIGKQSAQVYTIAPSYTKELGKGWALLLDTPLTYVTRNSFSTYNASLGLGVRVPLMRYRAFAWDMVPLGRFSGVNLDCINSQDLQCADSSLVYAGGVQSNIGINLGYGYSLVAQNQYTYNYADLLSSNLTVFGIPINSVVKNSSIHVYRNGLQLTKDTDYTVFGRTLSGRLSFADTRFDSGYAMLANNQQEYGFNINLRGQPEQGMIGRDLKIGISYTDAPGVSQAVSGNLGITF